MNSNQIEIKKEEQSLYYDIGGFKGNTFQDNINSINKLYYGQGLKISEVLYLLRNQKDNKYYLMANKIELDLKNGEKSQMFYYPENFLNQVFIYKNTYIFFISQDYSLFAFKLEEKSIKR